LADARRWLRGLAGATILSLLGSAVAQPQQTTEAALTELFVKAKAQFRGGGYDASLAMLQKLDEASRDPGLEAIRQKLIPAMAFYRGANLAARGRNAEARKEFGVYLASSPPMKLDPSMYPKSVIEAFNEAREESGSAGARASPGAGDTGLAEAYARFHAGAAAVAADEHWADGAIRFLMTKDEKDAWRRLSSPAARGEFVASFWQRRDPTPEAPQNEYREEIERRIQFADARFAQQERKGSETDRGMVFVLMGPPSYVGQRLLKSEDDPIQTARAAPGQELVKEANGRVTLQPVSRDAMSAEKIQGSREAWHYRRDRLPVNVQLNEVDFEFITKEGYGVAVLQRDPNVLTVLDLAARSGSER
jgi:GWxTD domain-containing protein